MKKRNLIWGPALAGGLAALALTGCGVMETFSAKEKAIPEYGRAETMVILTTERRRYEELYTEEIWSASVDNRGTAFETVLLDQVHDFLIDLKTMSIIARNQELELTEAEQSEAEASADAYFSALGTTYAEEFGLKEEDVQNLYTDYRLAEKLVDTLTGETNLEISDSEAKVIRIAQIEVSDAAEAAEILEKATAEGADFYGLAEEYSENDEIKRQIHRGMTGADYEKAAFALEDGEISGVVADDGRYYIIRCEEDYDENATRIRKDEMIREKKNEVFHQAYQTLKAEIVLEEDPELWQDLTIRSCPEVEADFFAP